MEILFHEFFRERGMRQVRVVAKESCAHRKIPTAARPGCWSDKAKRRLTPELSLSLFFFLYDNDFENNPAAFIIMHVTRSYFVSTFREIKIYERHWNKQTLVS